MTLLFNLNIFFAMILGITFGFILFRMGAANPKKIIAMLALKDYTLMKAILLGIAISSLGLFTLLHFNLIPPSHLNVRPAFVGVIIGGAIFGVGWALSGFCPGTSVVALGSGSKRAITFIVGGLVGAFLYTISHGVIRITFLFYSISDGNVTLANTGSSKYSSLFPSVPGLYIAGAIAVVFIIVAILLPPPKR